MAAEETNDAAAKRQQQETCQRRLAAVLDRPRIRALYEAIYRNRAPDAVASPTGELFAFVCTQCDFKRRAFFAATDAVGAAAQGAAPAMPAPRSVDADAPAGVDGEAGPPPHVVAVCANRLAAQDYEHIIVHELTHVYDNFSHSGRRLNLRDCEDLACSEIRAAREGECFASRPAADGGEGSFLDRFVDRRRRCTRYRAKLATRAFFPDEGGACVDEVFDRCYRDREPSSAFGGGGGQQASGGREDDKR